MNEATNNTLEQRIGALISEGYRVQYHTPTSAQLVRPKRFNVAAAFLWFLLGGVGLIIYVLHYLGRSDDVLFLSTSGGGDLHERGAAQPYRWGVAQTIAAGLAALAVTIWIVASFQVQSESQTVAAEMKPVTPKGEILPPATDGFAGFSAERSRLEHLLPCASTQSRGNGWLCQSSTKLTKVLLLGQARAIQWHATAPAGDAVEVEAMAWASKLLEIYVPGLHDELIAEIDSCGPWRAMQEPPFKVETECRRRDGADEHFLIITPR